MARQVTRHLLRYCYLSHSIAVHLATLNCIGFVARALPKAGAGVSKRNLTDRTLKALKPAAKGKLVDVWDLGFPGFGVRISDTGRKTFVLAARYPGSNNPTRRALGVYQRPLTLEAAHKKARTWLELIGKGIDPAESEERARQEAVRRRENSFLAVAEDFIAEKLVSERKGKEVARDIRRDFVPVLGPKPITEVTDLDILGVINAKKKTAPAQARNLLGIAKRFFTWAVDQRTYGLIVSPADGLKPTKIIGEKISGERVLSDDELTALWHSAGEMPYPFGPVYRLLVLSALRLNEAADASKTELSTTVERALRDRKEGEPVDWSKFDKSELYWIIPSGRMKGRNGKARPHTVPLTVEMLRLLESLPVMAEGPYLFSTTFGKKPTWISSKVKAELDDLMLAKLRQYAIDRSEDPVVELRHWTNHDIRRTVRSQLSRLKVTEEAREALLAHVRPGIKAVYDHHQYFDEKKEALELWAARLRTIVEPRPANVVSMKASA